MTSGPFVFKISFTIVVSPHNNLTTIKYTVNLIKINKNIYNFLQIIELATINIQLFSDIILFICSMNYPLYIYTILSLNLILKG